MANVSSRNGNHGKRKPVRNPNSARGEVPDKKSRASPLFYVYISLSQSKNPKHSPIAIMIGLTFGLFAGGTPEATRTPGLLLRRQIVI